MPTAAPTAITEAVLTEALAGLAKPAGAQKTLTPWLFYDERGSHLFEQITSLPEYYLTRTERAIFTTHDDEIIHIVRGAMQANITIAELGAGTASKTGILLAAATRAQGELLYQPIDISPTALDEAAATLDIPGLTIAPLTANYITETYALARPTPQTKILVLYIGSSIGNFAPAEAHAILANLRAHLAPGDMLLLGTDLAPSARKTVAELIAAYDDAQGITAAFNKNVLTRLNRELDADFDLDAFAHRARWNAEASRVEMHLEALTPQTVRIPTDTGATTIHFAAGETIHTENSHKFTTAALARLLTGAGFEPTRTFTDAARRFAVTLATAT